MESHYPKTFIKFSREEKELASTMAMAMYCVRVHVMYFKGKGKKEETHDSGDDDRPDEPRDLGDPHAEDADREAHQVDVYTRSSFSTQPFSLVEKRHALIILFATTLGTSSTMQNLPKFPGIVRGRGPAGDAHDRSAEPLDEDEGGNEAGLGEGGVSVVVARLNGKTKGKRGARLRDDMYLHGEVLSGVAASPNACGFVAPHHPRPHPHPIACASISVSTTRASAPHSSYTLLLPRRLRIHHHHHSPSCPPPLRCAGTHVKGTKAGSQSYPNQ